MVGEMISDAAEAADVVVVAVVIIVKGTAAADVVRAVVALMPVIQDLSNQITAFTVLCRNIGFGSVQQNVSPIFHCSYFMY